ncbi:MAG: hypothetical protein SWX82_14000 [Cyanobacteriota bacterium]|nr:hypothetical protein [Cyanobacteriota bacterium]
MIFGYLVLVAVGVVTFGSFAVPEPRVIETSICAEIKAIFVSEQGTIVD